MFSMNLRERKGERDKEREREKERKKERERDKNLHLRNKHQLDVSSMCSDQGWNRKPEYVAWPEIEPPPFSVHDDSPINWAIQSIT